MQRDYLVSVNTDKRIESAESPDAAVAHALSRHTHLRTGTTVLVTTWLKGNAIEADTMIGQSSFKRVRKRGHSGSYPIDWKQLPP